eukprot:768374-Hanusia_phi.AAC.3
MSPTLLLLSSLHLRHHQAVCASFLSFHSLPSSCIICNTSGITETSPPLPPPTCAGVLSACSACSAV